MFLHSYISLIFLSDFESA